MMRYLAGVDEAGLGPILGPLVLTATVFRRETLSNFDDQSADPIHSKETFKLLKVNDSKKLYTRKSGLKRLEQGVLAFSSLNQPSFTSFLDFLQYLSPRFASDIELYPWYKDRDYELPLDCDPEIIAEHIPFLQQTLPELGLEFSGVMSVPAYTKRLNTSFDRFDNKSVTVFKVSAICLQYLWENFADEGVEVLCDKQGGRNSYTKLLKSAFPNVTIRPIIEAREKSLYALETPQRKMRVSFEMSADENYLPTALASMYSKYLREVHMRLFNEFWLQEMPDLKTTAGYYTDGNRFLNDIVNHPQRNVIDDSYLIRSR